MTDKEKIIVEIERQKKHLNTNYLDENGALIAYNHIIDYINSMPEEPVSEDLEETAHTYAANNGGRWLTDDIGIKIFAFNPQEVKDAFKAGAKWQKKQMMAKAVEIAREKLVEKVCEFLENNLCCYIKAQDFAIEHQRLENDLKKAIKDE